MPIRRLTGPHAGAVRREMTDASPDRCKAEKGISGSTDRTTGQGFAPEPVGPDAASIAMQVVPSGCENMRGAGLASQRPYEPSRRDRQSIIDWKRRRR